MTNVIHKNMLGVLALVSLMFVMVAIPVHGEEAVKTATNVITAVPAVQATVMSVTPVTAPVALSKEDLKALKSALDGLQGVIVALNAYVAKLPKNSSERLLLSQKMNATLNSMSASLIALNGTLTGTKTAPPKNLVEVKPAPIVTQESEVATNPLSKPAELGPTLLGDKSVAKSDEVAPEVKATEDATKDQGLLSSLKNSLNSPPGVIVLVVFAMIFGVVVFMRVSGTKEVHTA